MNRPTPVALTIAGSDPSGGAGIQADLKTFHQFGVYGASVVTLITVQNTVSVERVECLAPDLIEQQMRAVLSDIPPLAIKTGALGNKSAILTIAAALRDYKVPLVIDPVMISKHGASLLEAESIDALRHDLLPLATLITPNLDEASVLTGLDVNDVPSMKRAAEQLSAQGARSVLIKGGHLAGDAIDILLHNGEFTEFTAPRVSTTNTHGAGCTYSAAIAASLALGRDLPQAIEQAKHFITEAIRTAPDIGHGVGPLNHFAAPRARTD